MRGTRQRVRTARGRTAASTRWLERQLNDPYVRRAKAEGYRSRAAYKLIELDEKFALLKGARRVVDLGVAAFKGCTPLRLPAEFYQTAAGGWSNLNYVWKLR